MRQDVTFHGLQMMCSLSNLLASEQLSDVVLVAGLDNIRLSAHRVVLAAASDFFLAMFTSPMIEATQKEVPVTDVRGETLRNLVEYCYTGYIGINEKTAEDLLSAADFLLLKDVVEDCAEFLGSYLDETNCLHNFVLGDRHSAHSLTGRSLHYICQNIFNVIGNPQFMELSADQMQMVLASNDLNIEHEEDVFRCLMRWVQHDELKRKQFVPQLIHHVRLPLMDPGFLATTVASFCAASDCMHLLMPENYHLAIETNPKWSTPRSLCVNRLLAIGKLRSDVNLTLHSYCIKTTKWIPINGITIPNTFVGVHFWHERLIVACEGNTMRGVECWDLKTKTRQSMAPLRVARRMPGMIEYRGSLYVIGGCDENGIPLGAVERLDELTGNWQSMAPLPFKGHSPSLAVLGGLIYVGVESDGEWVFGCYDPDMNEWIELSVPDENLSRLALISTRDCLYAFCGPEDGIKSYDQFTDTWTTITNECDNFLLISRVESKAYAICGFRDMTYIQAFDLEEKHWRYLPNNDLASCYHFLHIPTKYF